MEEIVRSFLTENKGKSKIIVMGEDHGLDPEKIVENVGKQITILRTVQSTGEPFLIYSELPTDAVHMLNKKFTAYYVKKEAEKMGIPYVTSRITLGCRNLFGSCDDLYMVNIKSHLNSEPHKVKTIVCEIGLLHAADMVFPEGVAVLLLNCTTDKGTNFAISELTRHGRHDTAEKIASALPYIKDSASFLLGMSIVSDKLFANHVNNSDGPAAAGAGPHAASTDTFAAGAGAHTGETFEPIWIKNEWNDWIIQCPICKSSSGTLLEVTHTYTCPNKNKKPNLSNRPTNGGRRKNTHTSMRKRRKSSRKILRKLRKSTKKGRIRE